MSYVPSSGPQPCDLLLVGEAPGHDEQMAGEGFVGRSGAELWAGLRRICGLSRADFRVTNVVKVGLPRNRDPKPEEIGQWLPELLDEISDTNPRLIVAAGGVAARVLLPRTHPLAYVHGIPHRVQIAGAERTVFPMYHPAAGLYNKGFLAAFYFDLQQLLWYNNQTLPVWTPANSLGWQVQRLETAPGAAIRAGGRGKAQPDPIPCPDGLVAVDTEGWANQPWGVSFSADGISAYVIPARATAALRWLGSWLRGKRICMHNGLHDIPVLAAMGVAVDAYDDTQVLAFHEMVGSGSGVLEQEAQNLGTLAYRYLGMELAELSELPGVDFKTQTIPDTDEVVAYAGADAISDYRLFQHYQRLGIPDNPVYQIDMGQVGLVAQMVAAGMPFDVEDVADYYTEVLGKRAVVTEQLQQMAARRGVHEFNPGSHDQVRALITQKYGLRIRKRTKGGKASTNEKALAIHKDHEFVKRLQDFRELQKLEGTYLTPLMEALN